MRFLLLMIMVTWSSLAFGQLEKMGLYTGASKVLNVHGTNQFFSTAIRVGAMASYRLPSRFSFETGAFFEFHEMPKGEDLRYNDRYRSITMTGNKEVNIGIPLGLMMRTNITPACVTYLKISANPIFNIRTQQKITDLSEDVPHHHAAESITKVGIQYFSTDIDFGFGTFWNFRRSGIKLCLEPKFTIVQHRAAISVLTPVAVDVIPSRILMMSRFGFEVTMYKDLF